MKSIIAVLFLVSSFSSFAGKCTLYSDNVVKGPMSSMFEWKGSHFEATFNTWKPAYCYDNDAHFKKSNPNNKISAVYESYNVNGVNDEEIRAIEARMKEIDGELEVVVLKINNFKQLETDCTHLSNKECQDLQQKAQSHAQAVLGGLQKQGQTLQQESQTLQQKLSTLN